MKRLRLAAASACCLLAAAAWLLMGRAIKHEAPPEPDNPMWTERLLDHPERLEVSVGARSARPQGPGISRRWTSRELETEWSRTESRGQLTLRSPRLEIPSLEEIDSIVVRFAELGGLSRFSLLWSAEAALTPRHDLQNRRELTALGDPPQRTFWIRGDDVAYVPLVRNEAGQQPVRFLFLRLAARAAARLESVALIGRAELLGAKPHGRLRYSARGEARDAFHVGTPGTLAYRTHLPTAAELSFGALSLDPKAEIRLTVTLGGRAGAVTLLDRRLRDAGRRWQDFRLALPRLTGERGEPARLTFGASSDTPDNTVLWSNPTIVAPERAASFPNVVLYVVDGLRADRLGFNGYPKDTTPFLDRLARSGVFFRNAYAQAAWTKPSVASLLTSLHPQTHGVGGRSSLDPLPESVATLQDLLRSHGYLTAQFTANAFAGALSNLDQGFDWSFGPDAFAIRNAASKKHKIHSDDLNARLFPWLERHARERFFAYVHSIDPHPPCSAPRVPRAFGGGDQESDLYDEELRFNDAEIGRLYEKLVELGIERDTLLVVTADHGEAFGDRGRAGHGLSVHQEEVRIPLLFARPGRLSQRLEDAPVQSVDVLPTILAHCGVPFDPGRHQGLDLLSGAVLRARRAFASRYVYPEAQELPEFAGRDHHAVIDGSWKLIVQSRTGSPATVALFDLAADPDERSDVGSAEPGRAAELHRALLEFLASQQRSRAAFLAAHADDSVPPPRAAGEATLLPQDALERLKSLGYLK